MIAGIILAAGASSRMGHPKALLEYGGETFIGRLVRILSVCCDPVIVVLGYHSDRIAPAVANEAKIVINPSPDRGQLSSLQTGLAAMPADADGFLFLPVDCPAVEESTVRRVADGFQTREQGTLAVVPQFGGKHGHPVAMDRLLAAEFLSLPPTAQARDIVHAHVAKTRYVDVDDPGILRDVDDPDAYRQLVGSRT